MQRSPNGHDADEPLLLDSRDVARLLSVCAKSVERMAKRGELPPPIRLGRAVRWSRLSIETWITEKMARSAAEKK